MPIFEYQCGDCEDRFEQVVLSSQAPDPSCPSCHSESVEKVYSTFAAQAKDSDASAGGFCDPMPGGGCGACGAN